MVDYLTFEENGEYRVVFKSGAFVDSIDVIYKVFETALESGKASVVVEIEKVEELDWFFLQLIISFARSLDKRGKSFMMSSSDTEALKNFCAVAGFVHLFSIKGEVFRFNEGY